MTFQLFAFNSTAPLIIKCCSLHKSLARYPINSLFSIHREKHTFVIKARCQMGGVLGKEQCDLYCDNIRKKCNSSFPWSDDAEVDWNGCRKLPRLPPPGQHPRLFFTAEELPWIYSRFFLTPLSKLLKDNLVAAKNEFLKHHYAPIEALSEEDLVDPLAEDVVDKFFKADPGRNMGMLGAYIYGFVYDDREISEKAKKAALLHARVVLRSRKIAIEKNLTKKPYHVWHGNMWDLQVGDLFGGTSYALLYDLMFAELSDDERSLIRNSIAAATKGRRGWGMEFPTRRIQSNWASYHSDLLILSAAIEGEEGYDSEVYSMFSDLMAHYMDYAFHESGHPLEDGYALNLGFREGCVCFYVMARRGHNIFNHPNYKKIWLNWVPHALEPHNSGKIYGGSSGSYWIYPTSAIVTKFMFPKDPVIDYVYDHYMCENGRKFSRLRKMQTRLVALAFAVPAVADMEDEANPATLGLPLDFVCRNRGKVISRSDWTPNAMWFTFDARPDGFLIGHDACSRGAFVLNADGRSWGACPEWKYYKESSDYSLPAIDGKGERDKAPFVKLLDVSVQDDFTFSSADLTYAYNWKWTTWAKEHEDFSLKDWEHEPNDPRDFGCTLWWAPNKLYGEPNVAFTGLHQWRKRIATVKQVTRSCIFVRATRPYVIIADVVKKDNKEREYSWSMTTPDDVALHSFEGTDAILTETEGAGRRLLIRALHDTGSNFDCSFRAIEKLPQSASRDDKVGQITFKTTGLGVKTVFLLFSLPEGESKPLETTWLEPKKTLQVRDSATDETRFISFGSGSVGETTMEIVPK